MQFKDEYEDLAALAAQFGEFLVWGTILVLFIQALSLFMGAAAYIKVVSPPAACTASEC